MLYAATPSARSPGNIPVKSAADNYFFNGGVDYALTRDQVLRLNFQGSQVQPRQHRRSAPTICPSAPIRPKTRPFGLFLQQNGPIGRRFVLNTRLSIFGSDSVARSAVEAPTIIVNDAFTSGGAQRRGRHPRAQLLVQLGSRLRARHPLDAHRYRGAGRTVTTPTPNSNYLGTYVFASLDAFEARTPRSYSRRLGRSAARATRTCRAASTSRTTSRSARTSR